MTKPLPKAPFRPVFVPDEPDCKIVGARSFEEKAIYEAFCLWIATLNYAKPDDGSPNWFRLNTVEPRLLADLEIVQLWVSLNPPTANVLLRLPCERLADLSPANFGAGRLLVSLLGEPGFHVRQIILEDGAFRLLDAPERLVRATA
ncbi:MAG: hypothetical protein KGI79_01565 [Patescibacteria group bacterium]|nr:hypothetical protein [Patescibacteria group bacterium]